MKNIIACVSLTLMVTLVQGCGSLTKHIDPGTISDTVYLLDEYETAKEILMGLHPQMTTPEKVLLENGISQFDIIRNNIDYLLNVEKVEPLEILSHLDSDLYMTRMATAYDNIMQSVISYFARSGETPPTELLEYNERGRKAYTVIAARLASGKGVELSAVIGMLKLALQAFTVI